MQKGRNPALTAKDFEDMEVGDYIHTVGRSVFRVPGGWVWEVYGDRNPPQLLFIPYCKPQDALPYSGLAEGILSEIKVITDEYKILPE